MRNDRTLFLSLSSLPLLALGGAPADTIAFAPEAKSSVTKTCLTDLEVSVSDFTLVLTPADLEVPEMTVDTRWTRKVRVTDDYLSTKDGRPRELERTYDEIAFELECELTVDDQGNTGEGSGAGTSEIAGKEVRFVWDEGDEDYDKSYVGEEGDVDLLDGLAEDMDFRALLPEDEVDPEEEWEIAPTDFLATIVPGGDLGIEMELDPPEGDPRLDIVGIDPRTSAELADFLGGDTSGEVTAKYGGTREEDGRKLAVIDLEVDVASEKDATDTMTERWGDDPAGDGTELTMEKAAFGLELEGVGELVWDVGAGRIHSYRFQGDIHLTLEESFSVDDDGNLIEVECMLELEGKFAHEIATE